MSDSERPLFVLAGGGTGGHLYPGLVVADELLRKRPEFEIFVYGTPRPIDKRLTEPRGYSLVEQDVKPFSTNPLKAIGFFAAWRKSIAKAKASFKNRPPAMILGLGGYAAGPAIVAGSDLKIPTALFNPDATPGRANQYLAPKVDRIFVQWYDTIDLIGRSRKISCTGCPVRPEFANIDRAKAVRAMGLDPRKKTVLVTGASQGAWSINMAVLELCEFWRSQRGWQLLHLTGDNDLEVCKKRYAEERVDAKVLAFTEKMAQCIGAADIIISRAGASTLAEITAVGRASILMPYPHDRAKHQFDNARILSEQNGAIVVEDVNDARKNAKKLQRELESLITSEHRRERMADIAGAAGRHDAAHLIATRLIAMADGEDDDELD